MRIVNLFKKRLKKSDYKNPRLHYILLHAHFPPQLEWYEGHNLSEDEWI